MIFVVCGNGLFVMLLFYIFELCDLLRMIRVLWYILCLLLLGGGNDFGVWK